MSEGKKINLRTIRGTNLERFYRFHQGINNKGRYFPIGFVSEPEMRKKF